jgi:hypothetical protein
LPLLVSWRCDVADEGTDGLKESRRNKASDTNDRSAQSDARGSRHPTIQPMLAKPRFVEEKQCRRGEHERKPT